MDAPAQIIDSRTLVPLRFVGEAFGCIINWDNDAQTAELLMKEQTIEVPISSVA